MSFALNFLFLYISIISFIASSTPNLGLKPSLIIFEESSLYDLISLDLYILILHGTCTLIFFAISKIEIFSKPAL